jgi:hypothetical protein
MVGIVPILECRTVVVPTKGRVNREVKHLLPVPMELQQLDDDAAPVAAVIRRPDFGKIFVHHGIVSSHEYRGIVVDQTVLRVSPRGLPSIAACSVRNLPDLAFRMTREPLFRRWTLTRVPCDVSLDLDAKEVVSSNAGPMIEHLRRRRDSMFVVGDTVYCEAPAPFLQAYGRKWGHYDTSMTLMNDLPRKNTVLGAMVLSAIAKDGMPKGSEGHVISVRHRLPAGYALVRATARAVTSSFSEHNPDLVILTGDLLRASGILDDRIELYDWQECRRIMEAMARSAYKSAGGAGLASIVASGVLDEDILVDFPGRVAEPWVEDAAISIGM